MISPKQRRVDTAHKIQTHPVVFTAMAESNDKSTKNTAASSNSSTTDLGNTMSDIEDASTKDSDGEDGGTNLSGVIDDPSSTAAENTAKDGDDDDSKKPAAKLDRSAAAAKFLELMQQADMADILAALPSDQVEDVSAKLGRSFKAYRQDQEAKAEVKALEFDDMKKGALRQLTSFEYDELLQHTNAATRKFDITTDNHPFGDAAARAAFDPEEEGKLFGEEALTAPFSTLSEQTLPYSAPVSMGTGWVSGGGKPLTKVTYLKETGNYYYTNEHNNKAHGWIMDFVDVALNFGTNVNADAAQTKASLKDLRGNWATTTAC